MEVKGVLLAVRRYEFTDEKSGEVIRGAKVVLGVEPDDRQGRDMVGLTIQDLGFEYDKYAFMANQAKAHIGRTVSVEVDVIIRGRYTKLKALSVKQTLVQAA